MNYPSSDQLKVGYSHAIADMNHDHVSDLIVTAKTANGGIKYQILEIDSTTNQYNLTQEYSTPNDAYLYGQSLFADFDSDGHIEHLLPGCKDVKCEKSAIFVRKNSQVFYLNVDKLI